MPLISYLEQVGIDKGAVIGKIQLCQKLLKLAQTPTSELAARPSEELTGLLAELETRLIPQTNGTHPTS